MANQTVKKAGLMSIITKGEIKNHSIVDAKRGVYQRLKADGTLVEPDGKNRPFFVFVAELSKIQSAVGFDLKEVTAFNRFKDMDTAQFYVDNFADCVEGMKIHTELSFEEFYAGQDNVKFKEDGVIKDASIDEQIYFRQYTLASKTYSPKQLIQSTEKQEVNAEIVLTGKFD